MVERERKRKKHSLSRTDINKSFPRKALLYSSTRIGNLTEIDSGRKRIREETKEENEMQRFIGGLTFCQDF